MGPVPLGASSLALRIGVRPADTVKALRTVEAAVGVGPALRATAAVVNGVLWIGTDGVTARQAPEVVARVRTGLAALDGTCVVEYAPPGAKAELDVWGDVGPALRLMRRLKAELDPGGRLNPGRFVGGL
jgi:glycolate oxidase FAD binding subunit